MNQARRQVWQQRLMRSGYFFAALLLHLILFLLVATLVIWKAPPPPPTDFFHGVPIKPVPPPPKPPASGDAANNPQFDPQQVVVPVVTPPSAITTAHSTFNVEAQKVIDQSLSHLALSSAQGTGLGKAGAGGSNGTESDYGSGVGGSGQLEGHLYDLKQTPDRTPTNLSGSDPKADANGLKFLRFLRSFVRTWDMSMLDNYFKAPGTLYATQICIPIKASDLATKAFHVDGLVKPLRWIIVYEGKVIAPASGTYRFVGYADDFMVVRWDGANVLDASLYKEELDVSANAQESGGRAPVGRTLRCGSWIQLEAGIAVPIQILIGEGPGGSSGFLLMIEKRGDDSTKGDYPLFQLNDGASIPDMGPAFDFSKKKMLFQTAR